MAGYDEISLDENEIPSEEDVEKYLVEQGSLEKQIKGYLESIPPEQRAELLGQVVGGAVGSPGGVIGAAGGAAMGGAATRFVYDLASGKGLPFKEVMDTFKSVVTGAAIDLGLPVAGRAIKGVAGLAGKAYKPVQRGFRKFPWISDPRLVDRWVSKRNTPDMRKLVEKRDPGGMLMEETRKDVLDKFAEKKQNIWDQIENRLNDIGEIETSDILRSQYKKLQEASTSGKFAGLKEKASLRQIRAEIDNRAEMMGYEPYKIVGTKKVPKSYEEIAFDLSGENPAISKYHFMDASNLRSYRETLDGYAKHGVDGLKGLPKDTPSNIGSQLLTKDMSEELRQTLINMSGAEKKELTNSQIKKIIDNPDKATYPELMSAYSRIRQLQTKLSPMTTGTGVEMAEGKFAKSSEKIVGEGSFYTAPMKQAVEESDELLGTKIMDTAKDLAAADEMYRPTTAQRDPTVQAVRSGIFASGAGYKGIAAGMASFSRPVYRQALRTSDAIKNFSKFVASDASQRKLLEDSLLGGGIKTAPFVHILRNAAARGATEAAVQTLAKHPDFKDAIMQTINKSVGQVKQYEPTGEEGTGDDLSLEEIENAEKELNRQPQSIEGTEEYPIDIRKGKSLKEFPEY